MEIGERTLTSALEAIRVAHRWTDTELATRIGISRPMWSMARKGSTRLGRRTLAEILREFPRLQSEVISYLAAEDFLPPRPEKPVAEAVA